MRFLLPIRLCILLLLTATVPFVAFAQCEGPEPPAEQLQATWEVMDGSGPDALQLVGHRYTFLPGGGGYYYDSVMEAAFPLRYSLQKNQLEIRLHMPFGGGQTVVEQYCIERLDDFLGLRLLATGEEDAPPPRHELLLEQRGNSAR